MKTVAALSATVCAAVLVAVIFAFAFGGLTPAIAAASLAAGAMVGGYAFIRVQDERGARPSGFWEWFVVAAFVLFSLRAFCWLVFWNENQVDVLSPNNLGDMSLHLTYINNLANGAPFWPDNPIFAGEKLHYPIGVDLFNALLKLVGVDVYRGLIWVGLLGCLAIGIAIWRWGRGFTLAGLLFNGGIAGAAFFGTWHFSDYQADLAWKSIPLSMLVTQRGLLYALPAGLLLLSHWRRQFFPTDDGNRSGFLPEWLVCLLYASMPVFHLHTFIFLSFLLGFWLIGADRSVRMGIVRVMLWSVVPATVLTVLVTGLFQSRSVFQSHSMIHWKPGWMQGDQNFFWFWFRNFGMFPLFVAMLCFVVVRGWRIRKVVAAFVLPAVAIFVFACFVMLAPWEWDNTKLMIWCYLAVLPFLWEELIGRWSVWLRVMVCVALFWSGFVSVVGGIDQTHTGFEIAKRSELDGVAQAVQGMPIGETFAAYPSWRHPLLLVGRKTVMGYPGHLGSHGIDYSSREARLTVLMNGGPQWREAAREIGAHYLFWGNLEKENYRESLQPWVREGRLVARGDWGELYDLQTAPR